MLLIELYVPVTGMVFDAMLEEHTEVAAAAQSIGRAVASFLGICETETGGTERELFLAAPALKRILEAGETLSGCGIRSGDTLILL